jgi:tetratricopeptide (TPR) repeat protein
MKLLRAVAGFLFLSLAAAITPVQAQSPDGPVALGGSGGGNPYKAPADPTQSVLDLQVIDVSAQLDEFLELNSDLAGSVTPALMTESGALRELRAPYADGAARQLLEGARREPKLQSPEALQAAAAALYARGKGGPAFACLLLAAEKAPTDAGVLMNLAAGALAGGRANEALPLIAAAERGQLPPGPWGIGGAKYATYLRAYAQFLRGEYMQARGPLQRLVNEEPNLSEAGLLLALVQAKLGEEPRAAYLKAAVRKRAKMIDLDHDPKTVEEARQERDGLTQGDQVVPSLADLYDLSGGRPGSVPLVPRPHSAEQMMGMMETYMERWQAAYQEQTRLHNDVIGAAWEKWRAKEDSVPRAYSYRQTALVNRAMNRHSATPELNRTAHEVDLLRRELDEKTDALVSRTIELRIPIAERQAKESQGKQMTPAMLRRFAQELNGPTDDALNSIEGLLAAYHDAVGREYMLHSAVMNGMLSVVGAPELRTVLKSTAEEARYRAEADMLSAVNNLFATLGAPYDPKQVNLEEGKAGSGPPCSDDQAKFSVTLNLGPAGVELNCNSVSLELEADVIPEVLGVSGEIGMDLNGEVTGFIGPKQSIPGVGSTKEGFYMKAGRDGLHDIGVKAEAKTSHGVGPVSTSYKVGEVACSFLPSPRTAVHAPGALPEFKR